MNIIRWIFFIPIAFVASIAIGALINIFAYGLFGFEWLRWIASGCSRAAAFIVVGIKIAPSKKNTVKLTLIIITLLLGVISALGACLKDNHIQGLAGLAMVVVAICLIKMEISHFDIQNESTSGISWWFTRGIVSLVTIPIALFLVIGCIGAFIQGGIQTIAYLRVLRAVFGFVGIIIFLFVWPFSLLMPGGLWWSTLKKIPEVIQSKAKSRADACGYFLAGSIFLVGIAMGMQWIHAKTIVWIADRNPDAAYEAGVTGTKSPEKALCKTAIMSFIRAHSMMSDERGEVVQLDRDQTEKMKISIRNGLTSASQVSDKYLGGIHPDLPRQFNAHLVAGWKMYLDGLNQSNPSLQIQGIQCVFQWDEFKEKNEDLLYSSIIR